MGNNINQSVIQGPVIIDKVMFTKGLFNILALTHTETGDSFVATNCMGIFRENEKYFIQAEHSPSAKYPNSYKCLSIGKQEKFEATLSDLLEFISTVLGEKQYENLVNKYSEKEIKKILDDKDIDLLTEVALIGKSHAEKLISQYETMGDLEVLTSKLAPYGITYAKAKNIMTHYRNNVQFAVEHITENPYNLIEVKGFGFKTADECYLKFHDYKLEALQSEQRIVAFIQNIFDTEAVAGNSYLLTDELVDKVVQNIQGVQVSKVIKVFNSSDKFGTKIDDHGVKRLFSQKIADQEIEVAKKIVQLVNGVPKPLDMVDETIKQSETFNGYPFSDEQKTAIKQMVKNKIFLLQGYAGTGKTTSMSAFTKILENNGKSFMQCCISGKAADNLRKATGYPAKTIASLLTTREVDQYDCIIIDEISMVDLDNFLKLLNGLKPDARLVMMGDAAQLDAIGIGVMVGLIESGVIPTIVLDKIHRQAESSAIITHSMLMRKGERHPDVKFVKNKMILYGDKKDLAYHFVDNDDEQSIFTMAMKLYRKLIDSEGVDDVLILCQTRKAGATSVSKLNDFAQKIANPYSPSKLEIKITNKDNEEFVLREGDRVMNLVNNTTSFDQPIFNGNTGKVLAISPSLDSMTIDFDGIGEVTINATWYINLTLGYCATFHKTQGMTLKNVVLALPFHYMLNSRELLYTGVTRAS
ncbi:TPA: AAA family ATPase, partial [Streptococcus suis]